MTKVQTSLTNRFGKSVNYAKLDGLVVDFNNEGIAEVNDSTVSALFEVDSSLSLVDGVKVAQKQKEAAPVKEDETAKDVVETEAEKEEHVEVDLSQFSVKDLIAMAKEANLPAKEYQSLNKEKLVGYLQEKLK